MYAKAAYRFPVQDVLCAERIICAGKPLSYERSLKMIYSNEVNKMCSVAQGVNHGAAPIPEEAKWVKAKEISDISGLTHGIGWCAPQQGSVSVFYV